MAPLRPTYEPLWDEQDMRAAIAAERRLLFQAQEAAKHLAAENKRLHDACASGWGEPALINTLRAELSALREQHAEAATGCDTASQFLAGTPSEDARDASRYRWLRGNYNETLDLVQALQLFTPEGLDAAIDAAREKQ